MQANEESMWTESSESNYSQSSNYEYQAHKKLNAISNGKEQHKLSPKRKGIKKMMKKLRKQKRQYKMMDKIFFSEKAQRTTGMIDPNLQRPISPGKFHQESYFGQRNVCLNTNQIDDSSTKDDQTYIGKFQSKQSAKGDN